ncbi:cation-transporting P-type ATPase, partial [Clostridium botulinum]
MWFNKTSQEILEELAVDPSKGLSSEEIEKRREKYGLNKLNSKKQKSLLKMFFEQLNDILIYILLAAAIISGILGEVSDALIIGIVVIINTVIGVVQESKAEKALDALKQLSTPKALVKRNGENIEI